MTEEVGLIGLLIAFSGGAVAYIKWLHDKASKELREAFNMERKLYDERIDELRKDKSIAEEKMEAMRQELMSFISSVNYVSK